MNGYLKNIVNRTKNNGTEKDFSHKKMAGTVTNLPQQINGSDCGLFVMHYFQKFFK